MYTATVGRFNDKLSLNGDTASSKYPYKKSIGLKTVISGNTTKYISDENTKMFVSFYPDHYQINQYDPPLVINLAQNKYITGRDVGQNMTDTNKSHKQESQRNKIHSLTQRLKLLGLEDYIKNNLNETSIIDFGDFVITTKEKYEQLTSYENAIEEAIDNIMYETAIERENEEIDISLNEVINQLELDADEILRLVNETEEEY